jgi:hypothetical protein
MDSESESDDEGCVNHAWVLLLAAIIRRRFGGMVLNEL